MSLLYIREAVVGAVDVAASADFLRNAFGFVDVDRSGEEVVLGAPGAPSGRVRLVPAAGPATGAAVWDVGPRLLGMYSRDLDQTVETIEAAGGSARPPVTYPYGNASLSETLASGPDDVWWTIPRAVPGMHRHSDAYETDTERIHSELHTAVLVVDDHDAALAFFAAGGLDTVFDGEMDGPDFERLIGIPPGAALRLTFMGGPGHLPARFEIMSFSGVDARDLSGSEVGVRRLLFVCDAVDATRQALVAAGGEFAEGGAVRGPAGILLDLVEEAS